MKIIEDRHPGELWLLWKFGNATAIDGEAVRSIGIAWGFQENGLWCGRPRVTGQGSLFYNAMLFVRLNWPLGLFLGIRWAGDSLTARQHAQFGLGWKLNGRLTLTVRAQSDASSAAGVTGPNSGQACGWDYGTK